MAIYCSLSAKKKRKKKEKKEKEVVGRRHTWGRRSSVTDVYLSHDPA